MLKGGNSLVPVTVKIYIVHGYWYCGKWIMYNLIKCLRIPYMKIASQCLAFSTKFYEAFKENWASNQIGFQLWIPLYRGTLCIPDTGPLYCTFLVRHLVVSQTNNYAIYQIIPKLSWILVYFLFCYIFGVLSPKGLIFIDKTNVLWSSIDIMKRK